MSYWKNSTGTLERAVKQRGQAVMQRDWFSPAKALRKELPSTMPYMKCIATSLPSSKLYKVQIIFGCSDSMAAWLVAEVGRAFPF